LANNILFKLTHPCSHIESFVFHQELISLVLVYRKGRRGSLCELLLRVPDLYKETEAQLYDALPMRENQWSLLFF